MDGGVQPSQSDARPDAAMLKVVLPSKSGWQSSARALARRLFGELAAWAVVAVVLVLLLTPGVVFLLAGCWAIVTYIASAVTLYHLIISSRFADLLDPLRALDLAGRVAVLSAGYYALLSALIVFAAGMLGKRWRRLFLLPGVVLTIPAGLVFYFGLHMTLDAVTIGHPWPLVAQTGLTLYLICDTILLAAFLVDLRPKPKRQRRRNRSNRGAPEGADAPELLAERAVSPSLPLVRFGQPISPPSISLDEAETAVVPTVPVAPVDEAETALVSVALPAVVKLPQPDTAAQTAALAEPAPETQEPESMTDTQHPTGDEPAPAQPAPASSIRSSPADTAH